MDMEVEDSQIHGSQIHRSFGKDRVGHYHSLCFKNSTSPNRFERVINMKKFSLCSSSTVMISILCSTFLLQLLVKTQIPGTFSLLLKQLMKPQSNPDDPNFDVHLLIPVAAQHPLAYPSQYQFHLNEPNKCLNRTPFLVLLVITKPKDVAKRKAIRQTWGNENSIPGISILCLFLSGLHSIISSPIQKHLEEESARYRDIIQQDFLDTYNNLTLKTLMGMEWVSKFCPEAAYVMKADSDIFLNVDYLVSRLLKPNRPPKKNYVTGYIHRKNRVIRNKEYKWYVPPKLYPKDTYPPYCAGPGYVLSGDLAKKIYQVAQTIEVFNMEDSFIGICLHKLHIRVTRSRTGLFNIEKIEYEKCKFSKLVVVHMYEPEELLKIWPDFRGPKKTCQGKKKTPNLRKLDWSLH